MTHAPEATQAAATPVPPRVTTTLTLARDGVTITIDGVPATERDGEPFIDYARAERIEDAVVVAIAAIVAARGDPATT